MKNFRFNFKLGVLVVLGGVYIVGSHSLLYDQHLEVVGVLMIAVGLLLIHVRQD